MEIKNSTEVRKEWSESIDLSIRTHPVFIKRNRDILSLFSIKHIERLLDEYNIYVSVEYSDNGTYTARIPQFDIFINKQETITEVSDKAVEKLKAFCLDYFDNLDININLQERAKLFPYVLKVIIAIVNEHDIKDMLIIKN